MSETVQSTEPSFPIATSEREALPLEVVAGTTTMAYVPALKGWRDITRPLRLRVQATDPEELEIAVRVVLTVPSDAVVTLVAIRLLPDNSRRPMFESEALQSIAPAELIALSLP